MKSWMLMNALMRLHNERVRERERERERRRGREKSKVSDSF